MAEPNSKWAPDVIEFLVIGEGYQSVAPYLVAVLACLACSASITFAATAAGGPGSKGTPIVQIGFFINLATVAISLLSGQGAST